MFCKTVYTILRNIILSDRINFEKKEHIAGSGLYKV